MVVPKTATSAAQAAEPPGQVGNRVSCATTDQSGWTRNAVMT
jgi:hypothetical protein